MQLERRDISVLICAEARNIDNLAGSSNTLMANRPDLRKALQRLEQLLEALEAMAGKRT